MRKTILLRSSALAMPYIGHLSAYANSFTPLIPDLFAALDVVSRELVGFIPSASRAPSVERAAVGQTVTYQISQPKTARDIAPSMTPPTPRDTTTLGGTMTMTKARAVEFGWTGEEQRSLSGGIGYLSVQAQNFAQALRTLVNEMESDLAAEAAAKASRAYGTGGTTPYATNLGDSAQLRKILDDNGAPASGRSQVINTSAGAALRTLQNLTKVNEAGTQMTLRDGELLNIHGFSIKESAAVVNHTKGDGASATTTNAGFAVGTKTIALASAGTGAIVAGDVVTFAGDTNKYLVVSGDADVLGGGSITIAAPGLRQAIPAAATNITVGNSYAANVGFVDTALHVATRLPALPNEGDMAIDRQTITDVRSGISFELAMYPGYRMVMTEVAAVWGVHASKPEHIALLLG